jgi:hypothetical protein
MSLAIAATARPQYAVDLSAQRTPTCLICILPDYRRDRLVESTYRPACPSVPDAWAAGKILASVVRAESEARLEIGREGAPGGLLIERPVLNLPAWQERPNQLGGEKAGGRYLPSPRLLVCQRRGGLRSSTRGRRRATARSGKACGRWADCGRGATSHSQHRARPRDGAGNEPCWLSGRTARNSNSKPICRRRAACPAS